MNAIAMMMPSNDNMYLFMFLGFRFQVSGGCPKSFAEIAPTGQANRRKRESPLPGSLN